MSTYPKRTIDLQPGDVLRMYGCRDRVESVESVNPDARYSAVRITATELKNNGRGTVDGKTRPMSLDGGRVHVEIPRGHRVIAVPIETTPTTRVEYGAAAIQAGAADLRELSNREAATDAVANVLHWLAAVEPEHDARTVLATALEHYRAEVGGRCARALR